MKLSITTLLLIFSITAYALNPSRTYKQRPDKFNIKFTEVKVKTKDGSLLNLWYFPTLNPSKRLMVIAHNGDGNMADYMRRVDQFKRIGYNVVTFDYRGYGESSEFEIVGDMFIYSEFTTDLEAVLDYCQTNYQETFDIYGFGIGAGLALGVGYNRSDITRIIADTPFLSLEDTEEKYDQQKHWMEMPFDSFNENFEPINALGNASGKNLRGVLLMIGNNDPLFRRNDMEKLRQLNKKLITPIEVIENPSRMDNFKANKEKYFAEISSFLDKT
jgi:pimeloyl-ACP methyl ester carboxylesterase